MGADEIIPEEFETSVEIFTRVLTKYLIPRDEIERFITEIRSDGDKVLRSYSKKPAYVHDSAFHLPDMEITSFRIMVILLWWDKLYRKLVLGKTTGVTLLAIRRDSHILSNPGGDTIILLVT